MKTKHKEFKPFDKVLVRDEYIDNDAWIVDMYSHYSNKKHYCIGMLDVSDFDILPYEGNEHLVGTTDEPDEEVKLEEGELLVYFEHMKYFEKLDLSLAGFIDIDEDKIRLNKGGCPLWKYAIRFSDFNPNDMEETKKHILCVKNGKIVRYKND